MSGFDRIRFGCDGRVASREGRSVRESSKFVAGALDDGASATLSSAPSAFQRGRGLSPTDRRRERVLVPIATALGLIAVYVWVGADAASKGSFRDHLDVFTLMLMSPVALVFPLIAVLLTCLRLFHELAARGIANTRTRVDIRRLLARRVGSAAAVSAAVFAVSTFAAFVIAFVVWPLIGDPALDPAGYGLTAEAAASDALTRWSYTGLLGTGELAFGLVYASWVGLAAAYAVLGICFLVTIHNRILALALPFLLFLGGTVAAALAGAPELGFLYSVFPGGLTASHPLVAATPTLVVVLAAAVFTAIVIARAPTNPRLA